jgi:hypothetical protein
MIDNVHKIIQRVTDILGAENIHINIDVHQDIYDVMFNYTTKNIDSEFKVTTVSEKKNVFAFCHRYTYDNKCLLMVDMPRVDGQDGCLPYYYVHLNDFEALRSAVTQFCEALKEYEKRYV